MQITTEQLRQILPQAGSRADLFGDPINEALDLIHAEPTAHEIASFLAEIGHESCHLQRLEENLNYSADALAKIWPKRFNAAQAAQYARHPEMIANRVYAGRYGNGDEASGDGWRYRGRGLLQITFKDNCAACGAALGLDLVAIPELLLEPRNAALSAAWFWKSHGLDAEDDDDDVTRETRVINGGARGLAERQAIFKRAMEVLA